MREQRARSEGDKEDKEAIPANYQLPTTNYQLPTTHSQMTNDK
ncbi:hypothetical protein [Chroococcidiopsis cubana]|nr:hypothetical protein [Chroococcidiopsis cubana]